MTTTLHPDWCGHGHVCSSDRPGGEHRSHPVTVDTHAGRLVVTRIRSNTGRDRVEIRVVADLPNDAGLAHRVTRLIVALIGQAVSRAQLQGGRQ